MEKIDKKDKMIGFYVTEKGKLRLDFIANWLKERELITEGTISEGARWCLDVGWTIIYEAVNAEKSGAVVNSVTIPLKMIESQTGGNPGQEQLIGQKMG